MNIIEVGVRCAAGEPIVNVRTFRGLPALEPGGRLVIECAGGSPALTGRVVYPWGTWAWFGVSEECYDAHGQTLLEQP